MPITPFHFGPGFLFKSVFPKWFSFRAFIIVNVVIDLEPVYFILVNQWPLHRFFHTYLGATVIAAGCILLGRPVCYWATDIWNAVFKSLKIFNGKISKTALFTGAFVGTYSHVFLDSIMHSDMRPLYPFNGSNGLLYILSYKQLHLLCVFLGLVGVIVYWCVRKILAGAVEKQTVN